MAKNKTKPLERGDHVYRSNSNLNAVWVISSVDHITGVADIFLKGDDLQVFNYPLAKLKRIDD